MRATFTRAEDAGVRRVVARFVEDAAQAGVGQARVGVESPEAGDDARHDPAPAVVEAGDPRPRLRLQRLRDPAGERVEVERGEVRRLVPHAAHLEGQRRADREEPGERAREAVEVGLHQRALLVLEELDVALPDEILGRPPSLRGRRRVLQDAASSVDRLEAGEDGRVVGLRSQERAEALDPVVGGAVGEVHPEDVVEDRVVRLADRVHVRDQQRLAGGRGCAGCPRSRCDRVQPEREQGEPDVVRRERGHPGPLEVRGQELVDPGVARRDLQVAVEGAGLVGQETVGQRLPPGDRVRRPVRRTSSWWLRG